MSIRYRYNSTIGVKMKECKSCGHKKFIFSKGRCADCARIEDTQKRMELVSEDIIKEENLSELIAEADVLFSRYVRLLAADINGMGKCYICDKILHWKDAQCMHYIGRAYLYLRYELSNCKSGCKECNEFKNGNLLAYAKKLDSETEGITEILYHDSHIIYKPTRDELRSLIGSLSEKIKQLGKKN